MVRRLVGWGTHAVSAKLHGEAEDEVGDGYISMLQPATHQVVP